MTTAEKITVEKTPEDLREHRRFLKILKQDLNQAARTLDRQEARFVVDLYYQMQEFRKSSGNRARAAGEQSEPNALPAWLLAEFKGMEDLIKDAMKSYAETHVVGEWALKQFGVGPVVAGAVIAYVDITKCPTAGSVWRFAGVDPSVTWHSAKEAKELVDRAETELKKGAGKKKVDMEELARTAAAMANRKTGSVLRFAGTDGAGKKRKVTKATIAKAISVRPWNASLKTLVWKIGENFKKFSGRDECFYGKLYQEKKAQLVAQNAQGKFADHAATRAGTVGKSTDAYKAYSAGRLPPGHLDMRALRFVGKLYLSHWHAVAYWAHHGKQPPRPYALAHLEHNDVIEIPHCPFEMDWSPRQDEKGS